MMPVIEGKDSFTKVINGHVSLTMLWPRIEDQPLKGCRYRYLLNRRKGAKDLLRIAPFTYSVVIISSDLVLPPWFFGLRNAGNKLIISYLTD